MTEPNDQDRYRRAHARVKALQAFYLHGALYVGVNVVLHIINLVSGGPYWAIWPLLGWGVGLIAQALVTYGVLPFMSRDWEERKIREVLDRERRR
jgi:hypothetical protein